MNHRHVNRSKLLSICIAVLAVSGCTNKGDAPRMPASGKSLLSAQAVEAVARKRMFFGHQSVGYNILQGVSEIAGQYPAAGLRIADSGDADLFRTPVLAHVAIGQNSDPESKIIDFATRMRAGIGGRADVAGFKFCYVDFGAGADTARVFELYRRTMAELGSEFPRTRFVHLTVPLKATSDGWKKSIKSLLGRPHPFIADNVRREEFNALMRREYSSRQPLFDLAAVEATAPDGQLSFDKFNGRKIPSLVNEYTYDSGHLNEYGRRVVAERFIAWLAAL